MNGTVGKAAQTGVPAIEARGVCVRYGQERVLDDVSFTIRPGELVGIAGPNGGGKSTLLRAILGLVPLEQGEVRLFGAPLREFRHHGRIGYVPQNASQVDTGFPATALEVVALGRVGAKGVLRWLGAEDKRLAREAMEAVGVADLARRRIGTLSGGQRQRVLLAKALVAQPELLLLDEPTTGVDPAARDEFAHLLMDLNRERRMTTVLVSHDDEILAHATGRVLLIDHGLRGDGPLPSERDSLRSLHGHPRRSP